MVEILKPKKEKDSLRFKLSETLEDYQQKIAKEMMRLVEFEWKKTRDPKTGRKMYVTEVDNLNIEVKEDEVIFTKKDIQTNEGCLTETRNIEQVGGDGQKFKSVLFKQIDERFNNNDDILFYKEVLQTLVDNIQDDEDANALPSDEESNEPIYIRDHKE